jgi:hypothetical protein
MRLGISCRKHLPALFAQNDVLFNDEYRIILEEIIYNGG